MQQQHEAYREQQLLALYNLCEIDKKSNIVAQRCRLKIATNFLIFVSLFVTLYGQFSFKTGVSFLLYLKKKTNKKRNKFDMKTFSNKGMCIYSCVQITHFFF